MLGHLAYFELPLCLLQLFTLFVLDVELLLHLMPQAEHLIDHVSEVHRVVVPRDLVVLAGLIELRHFNFDFFH